MKQCINCSNPVLRSDKKYCSYKCFLSTRKRKINQCLVCQKETINLKFCSRSCSGIYINSSSEAMLKARNKPQGSCKLCKKQISMSRKYCKHCRSAGLIIDGLKVCWENITKKQFKQKFKDIHQFNARVRSLAREKYKKNNKNLPCLSCGYNKHIEVCHIKPVKDFSDNISIDEINNIDNLIGLCPNCHWELDHNLLKISDIKIIGPKESNLESQVHETCMV